VLVPSFERLLATMAEQIERRLDLLNEGRSTHREQT
jgi:hypothetical protein